MLATQAYRTIAARREWHPTAWQLVDAMWSLFLYHKHYREWVACHRIGIESAHLHGNRHAEALLTGHLGLACHGLELLGDALRRLGDVAHGNRHHRDALALYQVVASPRARRLGARLRPARGGPQE